jgi:hypothetical protein
VNKIVHKPPKVHVHYDDELSEDDEEESELAEEDGRPENDVRRHRVRGDDGLLSTCRGRREQERYNL